jgi:hypothetical protein
VQAIAALASHHSSKELRPRRQRKRFSTPVHLALKRKKHSTMRRSGGERRKTGQRRENPRDGGVTAVRIDETTRARQ